MSKYGKPDPNDNVLEEGINWQTYGIRKLKRGLTETKLQMDSVNISQSGTGRAAFTNLKLLYFTNAITCMKMIPLCKFQTD